MSMNRKWICGKCGFKSQEQIKGMCPNCKKVRLHVWNQCKCGKWFAPNRIGQEYCSRNCVYKYANLGRKPGVQHPHVRPWNKKDEIEKICPVCGQGFATVKEKAVYCSKECWNHRATIIRNCPECGKEFKTTKSLNGKYCSFECRNKAYRNYTGEQANAWKGGKTKETKCRRTSAEYKEWRTSVFKRDGFTCQMCGKHGTNLEAHHIKAVCNHPDLIFDIDNGLTLCHECHKQTDNYANKAKEQAAMPV